MQVFYAPDINDTKYVLDENESKHIIRVLRMTRGTPVRLIDGKGNLFEGIIEDPDPKKCRISINAVINDFESRKYRLHVAISPLKNTERFEWFVEKSVEIGIDEITPLICRNTEKQNIKKDRLNNLIVSAMKQSLKATKTILNDSYTFSSFVKAANSANKMIAHCNDAFERKKISGIYSGESEVLIMVGPEGDFTADEINLGIECGFRSIHLGNSRLRTETAGVAACHSIYFINQ